MLNVTLYYDTVPEGNSSRVRVWYIFQLKRRAMYYTIVIVIPVLLTMILCVFGIFASGGTLESDVNIGLATFFALTVLLGIVADSLPKSDTIPLLGKAF